MKKVFTMLSVMAAMLISGQAIAKNMCHEVSIIKGHVDVLNKGLASKSAGGMEKALKSLGIHPSKKVMSSGKVGLKFMLQSQEGGLYTGLKLAEAGCHAQKNVEKIAKAGKKAQNAITHSKTYHHAKDVANSIHHAIVSHRHLVCKHWGDGHSRHYACRMRG